MARMARIALDAALTIGTAVRPVIGTAWQYLKVEAVPPLTVRLFNGPVGRSFDAIIGGATDSVFAGLQGLIHQIDAAALRKKQAAEAAAKALVEQGKKKAQEMAEAQKKEAEKKAAEAKQAVVKAAKAKEAAAPKQAVVKAAKTKEAAAAKKAVKPAIKKDTAAKPPTEKKGCKHTKPK